MNQDDCLTAIDLLYNACMQNTTFVSSLFIDFNSCILQGIYLLDVLFALRKIIQE